jgi:hypothetical protein
MKITKKQLLEGFNIMDRLEKFETPLFDPAKWKPRTPSYTPTTRTVPAFGGDYSTTFTVSPTISQRLKLSGSVSSLSAKQRGVPEDESKEITEPEKDKYYTQVTNWYNPKSYLGGLKSAVFYNRVRRTEKEEPNVSLPY